MLSVSLMSVFLLLVLERLSSSSLLKTPSQILRGYDSLFLTEDRSCAEVLKIRDICFHT
jgi:hypothetical protein